VTAYAVAPRDTEPFSRVKMKDFHIVPYSSEIELVELYKGVRSRSVLVLDITSLHSLPTSRGPVLVPTPGSLSTGVRHSAAHSYRFIDYIMGFRAKDDGNIDSYHANLPPLVAFRHSPFFDPGIAPKFFLFLDRMSHHYSIRIFHPPRLGSTEFTLVFEKRTNMLPKITIGFHRSSAKYCFFIKTYLTLTSVIYDAFSSHRVPAYSVKALLGYVRLFSFLHIQMPRQVRYGREICLGPNSGFANPTEAANALEYTRKYLGLKELGTVSKKSHKKLTGKSRFGFDMEQSQSLLASII